MTVDLRGKVVDGAGAPKVSLTVELWEAANWETPGARTASDTTDSDGLWNFDAQDATKTWIVVVVDGTKKYLIDARNRLQVTKIDFITDLNVNTINEHTSASGVTIDGLLIKDGVIQLPGLDIDGGTDIGEAIVDADLMILDNGAGGTNRKSAMSRVKTYIGTTFAQIATGSYTGDGATSLAITGVGFLPKWLWIDERETADGGSSSSHWTSTVIIDDNSDGMALTYSGGSAFNHKINAIIALGSDGFTVDDGGDDDHPNKNGQVYNYVAIG